ncbi:MAG: long-chain fatty acid--CoA ligase [Candidatus Eisenbacteria bacterium]|nr:long-chain fatty acid--CoA ligase [Candidatus Eisenbacteria bacterium]
MTARRHRGKTALLVKDENEAYRGTTFGDLDECSDRLAASLRDLGVQREDRVAIISYHGLEWVIADLAILKLGGIVVPIYHTLSPQAMRYIMLDAGCKLVFVENEKLFNSIDSIRDDLPSLVNVVVFNDQGVGEKGPFIQFRDLVEKGDGKGGGTRIDLPSVSPDDTATIVYTSGTTGEPKGVVLSHRNIVSNALSVARRFNVGPEDVFLSFLPLCHMFEKTCGCYAMLFNGVTIAYAGDLTTIVKDVQVIHPTILITVPRIVEKIYEAVEHKVLQAPFVRRRLVAAAIQCLNRRANLRYKGLKVPGTLKISCAIYDRVVASKFRSIAGGRLRLLVSGGAPLDRKLSKTLYVLGFNILEGYGLTETSPVVATACPDDNRLGSVGKPLDGLEVKIGVSEEILVRGPNVMKGYFNKPEDTAKVIDSEGWLHTGDQGRFDQNGNLTITGRIKEIIVTSYGKKVAPVPIETEITKSPFIDQVLLHGDGRKCLTSLIAPQRCTLEQYASEHNIAAVDYEDLLKNDEIKTLISAQIENATADRARYEKIKAFTLISEGFTVENRLLTPTLKLRRKLIVERYRDEIESMYCEQEKREP